MFLYGCITWKDSAISLQYFFIFDDLFGMYVGDVVCVEPFTVVVGWFKVAMASFASLWAPTMHHGSILF